MRNLFFFIGLSTVALMPSGYAAEQNLHPSLLNWTPRPLPAPDLPCDKDPTNVYCGNSVAQVQDVEQPPIPELVEPPSAETARPRPPPVTQPPIATSKDLFGLHVMDGEGTTLAVTNSLALQFPGKDGDNFYIRSSGSFLPAKLDWTQSFAPGAIVDIVVLTTAQAPNLPTIDNNSDFNGDTNPALLRYDYTAPAQYPGQQPKTCNGILDPSRPVQFPDNKGVNRWVVAMQGPSCGMYKHEYRNQHVAASTWTAILCLNASCSADDPIDWATATGVDESSMALAIGGAFAQYWQKPPYSFDSSTSVSAAVPKLFTWTDKSGKKNLQIMWDVALHNSNAYGCGTAVNKQCEQSMTNRMALLTACPDGRFWLANSHCAPADSLPDPTLSPPLNVEASSFDTASFPSNGSAVCTLSVRTACIANHSDVHDLYVGKNGDLITSRADGADLVNPAKDLVCYDPHPKQPGCGIKSFHHVNPATTNPMTSDIFNKYPLVNFWPLMNPIQYSEIWISPIDQKEYFVGLILPIAPMDAISGNAKGSYYSQFRNSAYSVTKPSKSGFTQQMGFAVDTSTWSW